MVSLSKFKVMKFNKLLFAFSLLAVLFTACKKEHYDVSNVHGVNAEGELLLPVGSKSITMMDLMERFELTDEVEWSESGELSFGFNYEDIGVISGAEILKFKDLNYEGHYSMVNPYTTVPMPFLDTVVSFDSKIIFESDDIRVLWAQMKSGYLDFTLESNIGSVQHVVIRSSDIKDEHGRNLELFIPVNDNMIGFSLDNLLYVTDEPNTLNINYEFHINVHGTSAPELYVDFNIMGVDLAFREMRGYVDAYTTRNCIDSVFRLFPDNLAGMLEVEGVMVTINERNTFGLGARLIVDTAMLINEGLPPYSILEPLPLTVDMPPQLQFAEVYNQIINGRIDVGGGRAYSTSSFIVNPDGVSELVSVSDTCRIDTDVWVKFPFSFNVDDITYLDTIDMDLASLELPEMIEQLTLELTFVSTFPVNLRASYYMYDSENNRITDTLLSNTEVIQASKDGRPTTTNVSLVVNEGHLENVLESNCIIMSYLLDSGDKNVDFTMHQKLDHFLKIRAKYKSDVE